MLKETIEVVCWESHPLLFFLHEECLDLKALQLLEKDTQFKCRTCWCSRIWSDWNETRAYWAQLRGTGDSLVSAYRTSSDPCPRRIIKVFSWLSRPLRNLKLLTIQILNYLSAEVAYFFSNHLLQDYIYQHPALTFRMLSCCLLAKLRAALGVLELGQKALSRD